MGVLAITDKTKVRAFTNLPEVSALGDPQLDLYINRAEFIISRLYDYDNTLSGYAAYMEIAANLLVENLVVLNTPTFKRSSAAQMRSEQIGSYSYTRGSSEGDVIEAAMTEEIMTYLRAFRSGANGSQDIRREMTHVFPPRRIVADSGKSGVGYMLPEGEYLPDTWEQKPDP